MRQKKDPEVSLVKDERASLLKEIGALQKWLQDSKGVLRTQADGGVISIGLQREFEKKAQALSESLGRFNMICLSDAH